MRRKKVLGGGTELMNFSTWQTWYRKILDDFGFSQAQDELGARILAELLMSKNLVSIKELERLIEGKDVYVFGAGDSLVLGIDNLKKNGKDLFVSADSATSPLVAKKIFPEIIVTDLDGDIKDLLLANERGSIVIIHAHGDNLANLKKYVPKFKGRVIGTTQAKPFNHIYNFGGFTDGDRAVFLAQEFKAKRILLVGFDFDRVGKLSSKKNKLLKLKKLKWAEKLIGEVKEVEFI